MPCLSQTYCHSKVLGKIPYYSRREYLVKILQVVALVNIIAYLTYYSTGILNLPYF